MLKFLMVLLKGCFWLKQMMPDCAGLSCYDSILWELPRLAVVRTGAQVNNRLHVGVRQQHSVALTKQLLHL